MATIISNRAAVQRALFGLSQAMNLRRSLPGRKGKLGDELIDTATLAIADRSVNRQQDPDGNPWAPLRPRTLARKRKLGLDPRINIETYTMLDILQIRGVTAITSHTAVMTPGLDEETRQKIEYAQEGGDNRPERPFVDLGKDGERAVDELIEEVKLGAISAAEGA